MKNTYLTLVVVLIENDGKKQELIRISQRNVIRDMHVSHEDALYYICQSSNVFYLPSENVRYHCYWEIDEDV